MKAILRVIEAFAKLGAFGILLFGLCLFVFAFGVFFGVAGRGFTQMQEWPAISAWLKDWQELVGAILGAVATAGAALLITVQIRADDDREARRDRERTVLIARQMMTEALIAMSRVAYVYAVYEMQQRISVEQLQGKVPDKMRDAFKKTVETSQLDVLNLRAFEQDVRYLGPLVTIQYRVVISVSNDILFSVKNADQPQFNLMQVIKIIEDLGGAMAGLAMQCETITNAKGNLDDIFQQQIGTGVDIFAKGKERWDQAVEHARSRATRDIGRKR